MLVISPFVVMMMMLVTVTAVSAGPGPQPTIVYKTRGLAIAPRFDFTDKITNFGSVYENGQVGTRIVEFYNTPIYGNRQRCLHGMSMGLEIENRNTPQQRIYARNKVTSIFCFVINLSVSM